MQTLIVQLGTTFVGDAATLVNGFVRAATHMVMAPVERIANACDVAGVLSERAARAAGREQIRRAWRALRQEAAKPHRSRRPGGLFSCLRFLGELT